MFFRIGGRPYTKMRIACIGKLLIEVNTCVHIANLVNQIQCIFVTIRFGNEVGIAFAGVSTQGENVINSQKIQVNQGVFCVFA